ncbi:uncharacterized protein (TIGR00251 family) [Caulobacter ginsengisoli]|uniref:UPF0235 protein QO010_003333 n=1 Tax=Caulobacter ginsengisoli TaxID=400775 RepID=A0ABU0IU74_9CAUL|nr:DUF167 family protein [Caulobacter ginsengisoli]MDQ0465544.1 uncharacterized protein (TIGR00251 family) [Caulobacter ginsengisoli]
MRLAVRLTPKGGRDQIVGWARDDAGRAYLKVRVAAPPVDGAANAALIALIAKTLGRPRSAVTLAAGAGARLKMLDIEGLDEAALAAALGQP